MLEAALVTLTSILFVVDPLGAIPAYLVMTAGDSPAKRRRTAARASVTATGVLALFAWGGDMLLQLFGISLAAFRIAGGIILFAVSLEMMRAQRSTQETPDEISEATHKEDVAITPLAIPMLAGPAGLSTVTLFASRAQTWQETVVVYLAVAVTGLVTYVTLRLAGRLHAWLGTTGIHVLSRILGFVLAAISVQFILDGLREAGFIPTATSVAETLWEWARARSEARSAGMRT